MGEPHLFPAGPLDNGALAGRGDDADGGPVGRYASARSSSAIAASSSSLGGDMRYRAREGEGDGGEDGAYGEDVSGAF